VTTSRDVRQLIAGLIASAIVLATILGSILLSAHDSFARPIVALNPTASITATPLLPTETPTLTPTAPSTTAQPTDQTAAPTSTVTSTPTPTLTPTATPTVCPPPPGWQRYTVGPFDNLSLIAQRFNTTVDALMRANCLAAPAVAIGQTIYVPSRTPTPTPFPCTITPPPGWVIYIVQWGDTLYTLAVRYQTSMVQLIRANCLTTTAIYAGQALYVPFVIPYFTPTPTLVFWPTPTSTVPPTFTPTSTFTPPTDTPTIQPTTPAPTPTHTSTPNPTPTDTLVPVPTDTPAPIPTDTPAPPPTATATIYVSPLATP
jgi:LysM repeat protein